MKYRSLNHKNVSLDREQLDYYFEKLASNQILKNKSDKNTYPIPKVKDDFKKIEMTYHLLNEHIKLKIPIHPAGEWLLDNFYIIEEVVETIKQEMNLKKYKEFIKVANGQESGFARIYILAYEIVNLSDNSINFEKVSQMLASYQKKKTLYMEEICNLGIFMQIALLQNIADVCEKIYFSQMQKYRVENILEKVFKIKQNLKYENIKDYKAKVKGYGEMKYPFIEYLLYKLRRNGKKAQQFIDILEEQVNKMGTTLEEVIKKEHFDIALKKVTMANCITSMKEVLRMDFGLLFEQSNGIEEILKKDPINIYSKMDIKTKELYRNSIKEIAKITKTAEIYIAKKALKMAQNACKNDNLNYEKKTHIGYYLISDGRKELYKELGLKEKTLLKNQTKVKLYLSVIFIMPLMLDILIIIGIQRKIENMIIITVLGIIIYLPLHNIIKLLVQYALGKTVKPKTIPKIDLSQGIKEDMSTFVVIPTILKSKEKVEELMKKLEVYFLANKTENMYFALLGDCSSGQNKEEKFDKEVIEEGKKQVKLLNEKYKKELFYFVYRKRKWNGQEECYLGWERKRGLLNQFNDFLLGKIENPFMVNTLINKEDKWRNNSKKEDIKKHIKYIITLDSDTELILNSGLELIGAMEHILNKPELNENKDVVINGHALMQPRIGTSMEAANKNLFTKIFAGNGGMDSYSNAISDIYQDNFDEGIFTGKGIYNLEIFSKVLSNEIPENMVLSHDLLEGNYLRCALASDIILIDGYPTSYLSYKQRASRWVRGDFQIARWIKSRITDKRENKKKNPLNLLSRYKILDNLIRATSPISCLLTIIVFYTISIFYNSGLNSILIIVLSSILSPMLIDILNRIIYRKENQAYQKTFFKRINSFSSSVIRGILELITLPDKAYDWTKEILKTIYRMNISKKHLLEWITSEDADKIAKTSLASYYNNMKANVILGILRNSILSFKYKKN